MKIALAVNHVTNSIEKNFYEILRMIKEASTQGASVILFPEMCISGLINSDVPEKDYPNAMTIHGQKMNRLREIAGELDIWIGIGIFEREGRQLYDTAVFINPDRKISLKYRRVQPNWHSRKADPQIYCQGSEFPIIETPFGSVMFLICGDLWDDQIVQHVRSKNPDYLFYLLARSFNDGEWDQERWDTEEMSDYASRCKMSGANKTFIVNYLSEMEVRGWSPGCFGGAWVINDHGTVLHQKKLGESGLLIVNSI